MNSFYFNIHISHLKFERLDVAIAHLFISVARGTPGRSNLCQFRKSVVTVVVVCGDGGGGVW